MSDKVMRVIELFSGIGGFHLALKSFIASSKSFKDYKLKVYPFDNNCNANKVYQHNFNIKPNNKNIEHLKPNDFDKIKPFIITMSPPCQPYTRAGIQNDSKDKRATALHHICKILPKLNFLPNYLMLENVHGFETSKSILLFLKCIIKCGYQYKIYSISPTQIGIPNTRHRIYILAKLKTNNQQEIINNDDINIEIINKLPKQCGSVQTIGDIIKRVNNKNNEDEKKDIHIDSICMDKIEKCKGYKFDIVTINDKNSECFTKAYATKKNFAKGTGSLFASRLIQDEDITQFKMRYNKLFQEKNKENHSQVVKLLSNIGLRYFNPKEMCLIMGFPIDFSFPHDMNDQQFYKLLGNSLNIQVVRNLLSILIK